MTLRIATVADIQEMQRVRRLVLENRLSDPSRVTDEDCREMLEERGRGWVYETAGHIAGFAIADNTARSIWALFVEPGYERQGIGRALHDAMLDWLFEVGNSPLWLTTDPNTRAARFYLSAGWTAEPQPHHRELRFTRDRR